MYLFKFCSITGKVLGTIAFIIFVMCIFGFIPWSIFGGPLAAIGYFFLFAVIMIVIGGLIGFLKKDKSDEDMDNWNLLTGCFGIKAESKKRNQK